MPILNVSLDPPPEPDLSGPPPPVVQPARAIAAVTTIAVTVVRALPLDRAELRRVEAGTDSERIYFSLEKDHEAIVKFVGCVSDERSAHE
ncbi:hypothetical protein GCM10027344_11420 [Spelaeicoccus albus]